MDNSTRRQAWKARSHVSALAVALLAGSAVAQEQGADLSADRFGTVVVRETAGVARVGWPASFGYPLPRGRLRNANMVGVVDDKGHRVAAQTRVLASWPDGSVRWILVDIQTDLKAGGEARLALDPNPGPVPSVPVRVRETADAVEVDTGALRFAISRKSFAVLESMRLVGTDKPVAGPVGALLRIDGKEVRAGPPQSVIVREAGPLRAQVELRGSYGSGFDYELRVEAYAGQPFVRLFLTVINRASSAFVQVQRMAIELPFGTAADGRYEFGIDGGRTQSGQLGKRGLRLYQVDNVGYRVDRDAREGRLGGWLARHTKTVSVGVAGRWLWQEYPKAIEVQPDRLVYDLWAPEADAARFGMGAAKTHELVIWAARPHDLSASLPAALARPLVGVVDPAWIFRTGALPQALPQSGVAGEFVAKVAAAAERYRRRNDRERWDDRGEVRCDGKASEQPRVGAYGMWNWGDWNFPKYHDRIKGCDAWGNLEYDTAQVLALGFAASGDIDLHDAMAAAARHFIDVDTIHFFPARPEWVGMNHPKNPLHFSFDLGGVDLGHTWTEGMLSYYFLTGEERGLAGARGVADYLVSRTRGMIRGNPRQWGWPQIALVAVYDATGEKKYLDAARHYARGGMRAHEPDGIGQWKLGILADGLAYTHAATGDPEIAAWLDRYVAAVASRRVRLDARLFPAVAYTAARRADVKLREVALARMAKLDLGSWGKPFSINGRIGFRVYSLLAAMDGTGSEGPVTTSPPR